LIQLAVVLYVGLFALWMKQGYQEFATVESSVTTKVKGITMSILHEDTTNNKGE
jgi:hypothetical protein